MQKAVFRRERCTFDPADENRYCAPPQPINVNLERSTRPIDIPVHFKARSGSSLFLVKVNSMIVIVLVRLLRRPFNKPDITDLTELALTRRQIFGSNEEVDVTHRSYRLL